MNNINDNTCITSIINDNEEKEEVEEEEEEEEEELKVIRQKLSSIQLLKQNEKEIYIKNLKMRISELEPKVQEIEILQNQIRSFEKLDEEKEKLISCLLYTSDAADE